MTNPIAIAPKPAQPTGQPAGRIRIESGAAPDFAGLIVAGDTTPSAPGRAIGAPQARPVATDITATPLQTELSADLSGLLEKLAGLTEKLDENGSLEQTDLDEFEDLLAGIETLLDQGAPLPLPDTPAFAALADLAASLGLTPPAAKADGVAATPFDALARLSTGLADGLREQAPELAARLTGLARTLDTHSAAIQTALADEQSIAAASVKHIESETKLNPAATIAAQSPEAPDETPAQPTADPAKKDAAPTSDRTLVKDAQPTAPATDARPANPQAGAAGATAASTSPTPTELDAPDGLTIAAPQAQTPTTGPQAAMRPEAALYQRPEAQINLPHIAAEISRHVQNGTSRFEIRLNPPELGRIDVRMEVDTSGNVVARLAVEKTETLDLLQRDQRSLERALADAGLDSAKTELEFSLSQQGQNTGDEPEKSPWRTSVAVNAASEAQNTAANSDLDPYMRGYARLDAVNLWV